MGAERGGWRSSSRGHREPFRAGHRTILASLLVLVGAAACDQTFEPLTHSSAEWSVFGYLDASADTQWIRVEPVRSLKVTSPDTSDASVSLVDLSTHRTIPLRDSVFRFTHYTDPGLGSEGAFVHNFWTTAKIDPGATYRFSAAEDGEDPAEAVVRIPPDYDVEVWIGQRVHPGYGSPPRRDTLHIVGLKHLPFVAQAIHFQDGCGPGVDTVWYKGEPGQDGIYETRIERTDVPPRGDGFCGMPVVGSRDLWIVASDSTWPSATQSSTGALGSSEMKSNVSNAVGFLGGVLTKKIPYERCVLQTENPTVPGHCALRYDEKSAALRGTVTESRCGDGAIDKVGVTLTELNQDPAAVRSDTTSLDGTFSIGALKPGASYSLEVRAKPIPIFGSGFLEIYSVHTDTLTFSPGEQRQYDVGLQRLSPCNQKP